MRPHQLGVVRLPKLVADVGRHVGWTALIGIGSDQERFRGRGGGRKVGVVSCVKACCGSSTGSSQHDLQGRSRESFHCWKCQALTVRTMPSAGLISACAPVLVLALLVGLPQGPGRVYQSTSKALGLLLGLLTSHSHTCPCRALASSQRCSTACFSGCPLAAGQPCPTVFYLLPLQAGRARRAPRRTHQRPPPRGRQATPPSRALLTITPRPTARTAPATRRRPTAAAAAP